MSKCDFYFEGYCIHDSTVEEQEENECFWECDGSEESQTQCGCKIISEQEEIMRKYYKVSFVEGGVDKTRLVLSKDCVGARKAVKDRYPGLSRIYSVSRSKKRNAEWFKWCVS